MAQRYNRKDVYGSLKIIGELLGREVAADGDRKPGTLGIEEGLDNHMQIIMWGPRGKPGHDVFGYGKHKPRELCMILGGIIMALDLYKETPASNGTRRFETNAKASDYPSTPEFMKEARARFNGLPNHTDMDLSRVLQAHGGNWTSALDALRAANKIVELL